MGVAVGNMIEPFVNKEFHMEPFSQFATCNFASKFSTESSKKTRHQKVNGYSRDFFSG